MLCEGCNETKLSKEFPFLPSSCFHEPSHCFECFLKSSAGGVCPECSTKILQADLQEIQNTFKSLYQFHHLSREAPIAKPLQQTPTQKLDLIVMNISGHQKTFPVLSGDTIRTLKTKLSSHFGVEIEKQRLIFEDKVLEDDLTFHLLQIPNGSVIQLLIVLFDFSKTKIEDITFDLLWGYPISGRDYLDATCFLYGKDGYISYLDYSNRKETGVCHSGDVMDNVYEIGHHTIDVNLKLISTKVTKIFFTLSAWRSPTIGDFIEPSVKVFDKAAPTVELSKYVIMEAAQYSCVIMCGLELLSTGWVATTYGRFSSGNAMNYDQLKVK
eukprot:TRINITY_DN7217_c0_g1_i1.p1 TRINITY_DN7217_c0_g1~~TRINITY_DN7217_c0_g1_i1.p1  ORF type:complete len:326 (+),score=72.38 TRINITY_DN7217_c0_g1_i1:15-992(+)